jgi:hypothetical protein
MLILVLTQQLLAQSFLGGSGQDLARFYLVNAKRGVVCSDRVVKAFGPNRFSIDQKDHLLRPEGSFLRIIHNDVLEDIPQDPNVPKNPRLNSHVDSICSSFLPLTIVGVVNVDSATQVKEQASNPSTLSLSPAIPDSKALIGKGAGSIDDLLNAGLSKKIIYPPLLGKFWFSCSMVWVSELDFIVAVGQVVDCKIVNKPDGYVFVPQPEKLRQRYLNAFKLFGDTTDTFEGIKQRVAYRGFEIASSDLIEETVTNPKMSRTIATYQDTELKASIKKLIQAAIEKYSKSENLTIRNLANSVDIDGEVKIGYKYGFNFYVVVPLKNGTVWLL